MPMSNTGAPNPNQFNQQFYQQQQNFRQPYPQQQQQQQQQYHYQQQQQQQQFLNQAQQQSFQHNLINTNIPVEKILPASSGQNPLQGAAHIPADKQINQLATNLSNLTTNQTLPASKISSDTNVTKAPAAEKTQKPAKIESTSTPAVTPLIKPGLSFFFNHQALSFK
jgi:hypothetical protein